MTGLPRDDRNEGLSLLPALEGKGRGWRDRTLYSHLVSFEEAQVHEGIIDGRFKLITTGGTSRLYDIVDDPHEQRDLAPERPDLVSQAMTLLDDWYGEMMRTATHGQDPMWTVMHEGGPEHTRGQLPRYLERLRETGRGEWAERLAAAHPREL